ncbi:glutathione S-transferase family protein [Sphingorhabdus sp. EL138]|uniref:glutathione S-transferase family protein n=1 Tax=Sphingorhabdus sp. EL138 TaxID=2073156 RepID=UPI000D6951C2|nr:glutathione S-transferase [Sphingorhabdus sp. EL138]
MTIILYGSKTSFYTGKVRAYLDWKKIEYEEVLATAEIHRDIIVPIVGRSVIPIVKTEAGDILQDSSCIIDYFESKNGGPSVFPEGPRQLMVALLLELFGDEWLTIPAMHYRWHYNEHWAYREFGATASPDANPEEQYELGKKRGELFKGFCSILGINELTIPAIEKSYEALLAELDAHFSAYDYLLGSRPSIGDYGLIGAFYAHLYRDPASGKIMNRLAPCVVRWVERMLDAKAAPPGSFLPDDEVPATLVPILERLMAELMPWLQETAEIFETWASENPDAEIPRLVGIANYTIEGVSGQRAASPFSLWMLQRPQAHYEQLDQLQRKSVDQMLDRIGGIDAYRYFRAGPKLIFEDYKIKLA